MNMTPDHVESYFSKYGRPFQEKIFQGLVTDKDWAMQMYEVMSADTAFNANEVGHCADQVFANGTSPLFISRSKISATTANTQAQLFILGVSRDPDHSDTAAEGFALRVQIREHILIGNNTQRQGI